MKKEYEDLEEMENFPNWKEYEEAYEKLKEQEAPDLWERIKAGIEQDGKISNGKEYPIAEKRESKKDYKKRKHISGKTIGIYTSVAAAALILVITIPFVSHLYTENSDKNMDMTSMVMEQADKDSITNNKEGVISQEETMNSMEFAEENFNQSETLDGNLEIENEEEIKQSSENAEEYTDTLTNRMEETDVYDIENGGEILEDVLTQNKTATTIYITKEKMKDITDFEEISFKDLEKETQNKIKAEIKQYKEYHYYIEEKTNLIYMKKEQELYSITGGMLK